MASTDGPAVLAEISNRLNSLEARMSGASNVAARAAQIEIQIAASASAITNVAAKIKEVEAQTV